MKARLLASILTLGGVLSVATAAALADNADRVTVKVRNDSRYIIETLQVSSVTHRTWGPDLLGTRALLPGYEDTLWMWSGDYDVRFMDQDRDVCVIPGVDFKSDRTVSISDALLLYCEGYLG